jgi:hypothetical protein
MEGWMTKEKKSILGLIGLYVIFALIALVVWNYSIFSWIGWLFVLMLAGCYVALWRYLRKRNLLVMTATTSMQDDSLPTREKVFFWAMFYLILPPIWFRESPTVGNVIVGLVFIAFITFLIIREIKKNPKGSN